MFLWSVIVSGKNIILPLWIVSQWFQPCDLNQMFSFRWALRLPISVLVLFFFLNETDRFRRYRSRFHICHVCSLPLFLVSKKTNDHTNFSRLNRYTVPMADRQIEVISLIIYPIALAFTFFSAIYIHHHFPRLCGWYIYHCHSLLASPFGQNRIPQVGKRFHFAAFDCLIRGWQDRTTSSMCSWSIRWTPRCLSRKSVLDTRRYFEGWHWSLAWMLWRH